MFEKNLEPATSILAKIGGANVAAGITGKHVSRVYRWCYPREKGGTGGVVPHDDATKLLAHAKANGIALSAEDFFVLAEAPADQGEAA